MAMPASQATGVTSDAGPPVEMATAQSKIEPWKKGVMAGTTPPMICGASRTARPIATLSDQRRTSFGSGSKPDAGHLRPRQPVVPP